MVKSQREIMFSDACNGTDTGKDEKEIKEQSKCQEVVSESVADLVLLEDYGKDKANSTANNVS